MRMEGPDYLLKLIQEASEEVYSRINNRDFEKGYRELLETIRDYPEGSIPNLWMLEENGFMLYIDADSNPNRLGIDAYFDNKKVSITAGLEEYLELQKIDLNNL